MPGCRCAIALKRNFFVIAASTKTQVFYLAKRLQALSFLFKKLLFLVFFFFQLSLFLALFFLFSLSLFFLLFLDSSLLRQLLLVGFPDRVRSRRFFLFSASKQNKKEIEKFKKRKIYEVAFFISL